MLAHGPVTVGAPGTLTSMMSPSCRVAPANIALTSSYLAWSWLRVADIHQNRGGHRQLHPPGRSSTFTAVTWARNDGGQGGGHLEAELIGGAERAPGRPGGLGPVTSISPGGRVATTARTRPLGVSSAHCPPAAGHHERRHLFGHHDAHPVGPVHGDRGRPDPGQPLDALRRGAGVDVEQRRVTGQPGRRLDLRRGLVGGAHHGDGPGREQRRVQQTPHAEEPSERRRPPRSPTSRRRRRPCWRVTSVRRAEMRGSMSAAGAAARSARGATGWWSDSRAAHRRRAPSRQSPLPRSPRGGPRPSGPRRTALEHRRRGRAPSGPARRRPAHPCRPE